MTSPETQHGHAPQVERPNPEVDPAATTPMETAHHETSSSLVVDIYDQIYRLRGPDPEYLQQLAALVDAKMRAVAQHGTTVDSLRVAVLAALNIADELVTLQQRYDSQTGNVVSNIKSRTETLAEMLDAVLESNRKAG